MIGGGLKRSLRKPVRTLLFLLLMMVTVAFLSIGAYLFSAVAKGLEEIESIYRTVGTVEQTNRTTVTEEKYDRVFDKYVLSVHPVYDEPVDLTSLYFEGADYIYPPENRPYYHVSTNTKNFLYSGIFLFSQAPIAEYKIIDEYENGMYVKAEVVRTLNNVAYKPGNQFYLYRHFGETDFALELGKTYISALWADSRIMGSVYWNSEFGTWPDTAPMVPGLYLTSMQIDSQGNRLDTGDFQIIEEQGAIEVTDGLYETELWERMTAAMEGFIVKEREIRVVATNSLGLLMDFYNKNTYLIAGREITQEEFDDGRPVCLVQQDMAEGNNLNVGDRINLSFMNSVYGYTLGNNQYVTGAHYPMEEDINYMTSINAAGQPYEPFFEDEYEIVGIYERVTKDKFWASGTVDYYAVGYGTIIVPAKSIGASDENNRNGDLNLKPYNVSFEIPNGTINAYMEKVQELGLGENLKFTFYDGGYENIKEGLGSMRSMAVILLLSGGVTSLAALFFFTFLLIGKEKRSVAVERSLGVTKGKSAVSMLLGVLLIVLIGAGTGTAVGAVSSHGVYDAVQEMAEEEAYRTEFSNWTNTFVSEVQVAAEPADTDGDAQETAGGIMLSVLVFLSVVMAELVIAVFFIRSNLSQEPMELLASQ